MQREKRDQENMTCTIFSVLFSMYFAEDYYFTVWSKPDENCWTKFKKKLVEIEMFIVTNDNLTKVQNMLEGYSGEKFAGAVKKILLCSVEVVKKSDLHTFKGLKRIAVFGRIANANFLLQNKCPFLHYSLLF